MLTKRIHTLLVALYKTNCTCRISTRDIDRLKSAGMVCVCIDGLVLTSKGLDYVETKGGL